MVTPGKSGRSSSSTCPMFIRWVAPWPMVRATEPSPLSGTAARSDGRRGVAGEEDQSVLADLDLVGVLEHDLVDAVAVDIGAVEAPGIGHRELSDLAGEDRVPARDRDVVE